MLCGNMYFHSNFPFTVISSKKLRNQASGYRSGHRLFLLMTDIWWQSGETRVCSLVGKLAVKLFSSKKTPLQTLPPKKPIALIIQRGLLHPREKPLCNFHPANKISVCIQTPAPQCCMRNVWYKWQWAEPIPHRTPVPRHGVVPARINYSTWFLLAVPVFRLYAIKSWATCFYLKRIHWVFCSLNSANHSSLWFKQIRFPDYSMDKSWEAVPGR